MDNNLYQLWCTPLLKAVDKNFTIGIRSYIASTGTEVMKL